MTLPRESTPIPLNFIDIYFGTVVANLGARGATLAEPFRKDQ